jgi:arylsulfatase
LAGCGIDNAEIEINGEVADGTIIAQGGTFGGWGLYAKDGKPEYCYNYFGLERTVVLANRDIPSGKHQVRAEFNYDGGGLGKGATISLYLDGQKVAEGRVEHTHPMMFSGDETTDVGVELGSKVGDGQAPGTPFTGAVHWVQIDLGADDHDHLISTEERVRIAMARQ